jgi:Asp-tRNA(Asn)/Glu-tRNA(Gln) amidotransferase A subunit family amidase
MQTLGQGNGVPTGKDFVCDRRAAPPPYRKTGASSPRRCESASPSSSAAPSDDSFRDVDVVLLPTRRHTPRTVDAALEREETDKPRNPELENTGAFNVYGIPAISVPCGFTDAGLPMGLMIAGPQFSEDRVLALARAFEQAVEWHTRRPPLAPDTPVPPLKRVEGE